MATDAAIYVRIDSKTKNQAEAILKELGLTPSVLINMLYRQVILTGRVPFDIRLPVREPIAIGGMSEDELDKVIQTGLDDIKEGRVHSWSEVEAMLKGRYGH